MDLTEEEKALLASFKAGGMSWEESKAVLQALETEDHREAMLAYLEKTYKSTGRFPDGRSVANALSSIRAEFQTSSAA